MKRHLLILGAVIVVHSFAAAPTARAYDFGYGYGLLYNSLRFNVPHFAAYPPVYYSYPVPRSYGYSPFAYPPHVMTPEIVGGISPLEIVNPYVPSSQQKPADAQSDRTAAASAPIEPLVIVNPFVAPSRAVAQQR